MYALKTCPHCAARLSFFRVHFLQIAPYKCPRCGQTSNVPLSQLNRINSISFVAVFGVSQFGIALFGWGWWWIACMLVFSILYPLAVVLFCRFEPVAQEVNAKD